MTIKAAKEPKAGGAKAGKEISAAAKEQDSYSWRSSEDLKMTLPKGSGLDSVEVKHHKRTDRVVFLASATSPSEGKQLLVYSIGTFQAFQAISPFGGSKTAPKFQELSNDCTAGHLIQVQCKTAMATTTRVRPSLPPPVWSPPASPQKKTKALKCVLMRPMLCRLWVAGLLDERHG